MDIINEIIKSRETEGIRFKPTREFYKQIGIGHRRFGQLKRGEVSPTIEEIKTVADFFDVKLSDLILFKD